MSKMSGVSRLWPAPSLSRDIYAVMRVEGSYFEGSLSLFWTLYSRQRLSVSAPLTITPDACTVSGLNCQLHAHVQMPANRASGTRYWLIQPT